MKHNHNTPDLTIAQPNYRRVLSVFLSLVMVLTAVAVGIIPLDTVVPTASAAITSQTAGGYYLRVTHNAPGDVSKTSSGGWGSTPNDAYIVASRTYGTNGRASSASYGWNFWTSSGSKTYIEPRTDDNDGSPLSAPVGFPDGIYASLNDNKTSGSTTATITS